MIGMRNEQRRINIFILLFLLGLFFYLLFSPSSYSSSKREKLENPLKTSKKEKKSGRINEYCFFSFPEGKEGNFSMISSSWKLFHVVINLRHGDRTSIHNLGDISYSFFFLSLISCFFLSFSYFLFYFLSE